MKQLLFVLFATMSIFDIVGAQNDFPATPTSYAQIDYNLIVAERLLGTMRVIAESVRSQLTYEFANAPADFRWDDNTSVFPTGLQKVDSAFHDINDSSGIVNLYRHQAIIYYTNLRLNMKHGFPDIITASANDIDVKSSTYAIGYPTAVSSGAVMSACLTNIVMKHQRLVDTVNTMKNYAQESYVAAQYAPPHPDYQPAHYINTAALDALAAQLVYDASDATPTVQLMSGSTGRAHIIRRDLVYELKTLQLNINQFN